MVNINGTYKYDRYERNRLKSLCEMSNVKVFATKDIGQMNMTDYIGPSYPYGSIKTQTAPMSSSADRASSSYSPHGHIALVQGKHSREINWKIQK